MVNKGRRTEVTSSSGGRLTAVSGALRESSWPSWRTAVMNGASSRTLQRAVLVRRARTDHGRGSAWKQRRMTTWNGVTSSPVQHLASAGQMAWGCGRVSSWPGCRMAVRNRKRPRTRHVSVLPCTTGNGHRRWSPWSLGSRRGLFEGGSGMAKQTLADELGCPFLHARHT